MDIRNIYCVGRNYRLHAAELGNEVPTSPMFFTKPTHALVEANGQGIDIPGGRGEVHFEAEFVIHLAKAYQPGMKVEEAVDSFGLGIDFTLRDVQSELKKKGHPWLAAKGFRNAAVLTRLLPFSSVEACKDVPFSLKKNGEQVQKGTISEMIFDLEALLTFAAENYGLGAGDLIYTGTPAGVGAVHNGDRLELFWGEELLGDCIVRLV